MFKKKSAQDVLVEENPDETPQEIGGRGYSPGGSAEDAALPVVVPAEKLVGADGSVVDILPSGGEPALPPARYVQDKGNGTAVVELGRNEELHSLLQLQQERMRSAPAPQTPSVGRIVHYKLRGRDVMAIRDARLLGLSPGAEHQEGQVLPAIIVKVTEAPSGTNAGACNLKVMVDAGIPDLWVQSVTRGDSNGQWNWPPRV